MTLGAIPAVLLEVPGVPAPQGSKRAFIVAGRARTVEGGSGQAREKHHAWRYAVTVAARERTEVVAPPVHVSVRFRLPRPKAHRRASYVTVKPDLDKLVRATLDGLEAGGLIASDAHVALITAAKCYVVEGETPGATISVATVGSSA